MVFSQKMCKIKFTLHDFGTFYCAINTKQATSLLYCEVQ
jgi:hypothetical protein